MTVNFRNAKKVKEEVGGNLKPQTINNNCSRDKIESNLIVSNWHCRPVVVVVLSNNA